MNGKVPILLVVAGLLLLALGVSLLVYKPETGPAPGVESSHDKAEKDKAAAGTQARAR